MPRARPSTARQTIPSAKKRAARSMAETFTCDGATSRPEDCSTSRKTEMITTPATAMRAIVCADIFRRESDVNAAPAPRAPARAMNT